VSFRFGAFRNLGKHLAADGDLLSSLSRDDRVVINFQIVEADCLALWLDITDATEEKAKTLSKSVDFVKNLLVTPNLPDRLPAGCLVDMQHISTAFDISDDTVNSDAIASLEWIEAKLLDVGYKGLLSTIANCGNYKVIKAIAAQACARREKADDKSAILRNVSQRVEFIADPAQSVPASINVEKQLSSAVVAFFNHVSESPDYEADVEVFGKVVGVAVSASERISKESISVLETGLSDLLTFRFDESDADTALRKLIVRKMAVVESKRNHISSFGFHDLATISAKSKVATQVMTKDIRISSDRLLQLVTFGDEMRVIFAHMQDSIFARLDNKTNYLEIAIERYEQTRLTLETSSSVKKAVGVTVDKIMNKYSVGLSLTSAMLGLCMPHDA
jgi:hypothetical protein